MQYVPLSKYGTLGCTALQPEIKKRDFRVNDETNGVIVKDSREKVSKIVKQA